MEQSIQDKEQQKDVWTGGIEWDRFFNIRVFLFIILLVYLSYLFMKHVVPLYRKTFTKP